MGYVDQEEDEASGTRSGRLIFATPDGCSNTDISFGLPAPAAIAR